MIELFPPIEPCETEFLGVANGHRIFIEQAVNPTIGING